MKCAKCGLELLGFITCQGCGHKNDDFSCKSQSAGSPDFTKIANRIRIIALGCRNKDAFSCEFGNEFAPKVEDYLRECFEKAND